MQLAPPSHESSQGAQPSEASKAKRKVTTSESKEPSETEVVAQVDTTTEPTVAATVDDKPQATPASPLQKSPNIVKKESIGGPLEHSSVLAKPAAQLEDGEEGKRLFSETRRMLQLHHEHAMTLAELVERFRRNEDPTLPTAEQLYQLLVKFNTKEGGTGTGGRTTKIMQVLIVR